MAQSGYTPIKLYSSTTPAATPTAGNLEQGELAINTNDGKLFYEDSSGVVQVMATKDAAAGNFATVDTTNIEVTNLKAKDGTAAGSIADATGVVTLGSSILTTTDINGGTIDGTTIGGATPAAVSSTNLAYTGTLTGGTGIINIGSGQVYKDASGNVGIGGIPSGGYKLQVTNGSVYVGVNSDATNGLVESNGPLFVRTNAAEPIIFGTGSGGTERLRITSAGNVGIGTSSPSYQLNTSKAGGVGDAGQLVRFTNTSTGNSLGPFHLTLGTANYFALNPGMVLASTNSLGFAVGDGSDLAGQRKMTITSTGDVGIGTSSPAFKLHINGASSQFACISTTDTTSTTGILFGDSASNTVGRVEYVHSSDLMQFYTAGTVKSVIDASGNLLMSTASAYFQLKSASTLFNISAQAGGNDFLRITANGTQRYQFNNLGAAYNSTGTWGTISDVRLKENIVDATPKLDAINQLRVVNFNLKDEPEVKQIGFIAQEIEQVFPSLVENGEEDGKGGYYKAVKTTVLIPMLVKAIQELKAEFDAYKAAHP